MARKKVICDWDCFHCPYPDCVQGTYEIPDGICRSCRKNPVLPGRKSCRECTEKSRAQVREKREKRIAAGLCPVCGKNPIPPGTRGSCEECLARARANRKKRREVIPNEI